MKELILTLTMVIACVSSMMADTVFLYNSKGKSYYETDPSKVTVTFDNEDGFSFDEKYRVVEDKLYDSYVFDVNSEEYRYIVENDLRRVEGPVLIVYPDKREYDMYVGVYFYIGLKDAKDTSVLDKWVEKYNLNIYRQNLYMPQCWTLTVTPETGYNALDMANLMHESGDFEWCQPDLLNSVHLEDSIEDTTNIENIEQKSEVKAYYDLQGRRVENPGGGIYIERSGDKARKVVIRK